MSWELAHKHVIEAPLVVSNASYLLTLNQVKKHILKSHISFTEQWDKRSGGFSLPITGSHGGVVPLGVLKSE